MQKVTFKKGESYMATTKGKTNTFTLNSELYIIEPFWEKLVNKARAHYADFSPKTGILKHMRSEFVSLLDNLSTARKKDYPSTSEGSVIDLLTPTKPTTEGAIDLLTPRKPTTEGAIDLLTPRKPTMQGAMLSIDGYPKDDELEESWSQLQDKTKKHKCGKKSIDGQTY
jgi:hypothetical protein